MAVVVVVVAAAVAPSRGSASRELRPLVKGDRAAAGRRSCRRAHRSGAPVHVVYSE